MAVFYFHLFLCIASMTVMWVLQLMHYPLMPFIDKEKWPSYLEKRRRATLMILYPLFSFEALSGFSLLLIATQSPSYPFLALSLVLLVCLILYTFIYLTPLLKKINGPDDLEQIANFEKWHWVRTIAWTFRFLLFLLMLAGAS